jgi:hypothetical protein
MVMGTCLNGVANMNQPAQNNKDINVISYLKYIKLIKREEKYQHQRGLLKFSLDYQEGGIAHNLHLLPQRLLLRCSLKLEPIMQNKKLPRAFFLFFSLPSFLFLLFLHTVVATSSP